MRTNIAITGASGFIGQHLAKKLAEQGYRLKCLVRGSSESAFLANLGAELEYGDVRQAESLQSLVQDTEVVFHLAGEKGVPRSIENPSSTFITNTLGTLNLLEALRLGKHFDCLVIYLSSDRVYGKPESDVVKETDLAIPLEPYAASKLSAEHICQAYTTAYSIPSIIIRAANVYGQERSGGLLITSLIRQILSAKQQIHIGNKDTYRNFIYIEDLVEALHLILLRRKMAENMIFNVAEKAAKVEDIVKILLRLANEHLGRKIKVVQDPLLARPSTIEGGKYELDCSRAHQILGWSPRYSLEEGLELTFKLSMTEKRTGALSKG